MKNRYKHGIEHKQAGVLIFAVVVMIVILGFVGLSATYQYIGHSKSGAHTTDYVQSRYMANSGVEYAQYQISKKGITCANLVANNFAVSGMSGRFTTASAATKASGFLAAGATKTGSSIQLTQTTGFATKGIAYIDNELVRYNGLSGGALLNVARGGGATFPATHNIGSVIAQNQCAVTVSGGVPNLTSTTGKAITSSYLLQQGFTASFGTVQTAPAITSAGIVALSGTTTVSNNTALDDGAVQTPNFKGSTILSGSLVSLQNSASTYVSNGTQSVLSSNSSNFENDIVYNDSANVNATSLFNMFFTGTKASIQSISNQLNATDILNGMTGQMLWVNGCVSILMGTIGSISSPVILIVNGNLEISGNVTIYGFVYVTGSVTMTNGATIHGALASETGIAIDDSSVNMNMGILTYLYNQFTNSLVGRMVVVPNMTTQVTS